MSALDLLERLPILLDLGVWEEPFEQINCLICLHYLICVRLNWIWRRRRFGLLSIGLWLQHVLVLINHILKFEDIASLQLLVLDHTS